MIQRIDQLDSPVTVGRYYLVPTVIGTWYGKLQAWPVIGPKHNDRHCLEFANDHYHLDARFMATPRGSWDAEISHWRSAWGSPMQINDQVNSEGLPAPVWRKMLCKRPSNPVIPLLIEQVSDAIKAGRSPQWKCHVDEWQGRQAKRDARGWVCPHRSVSLANHGAVDGVITCPLHLLRIDAATGIVLPLRSDP
ncbi:MULTISPECIES: Rieske 2Fe-2S domain-containing protein [unclassified Rhizobium]|uniref:Rieske 2Fe-2S domain-containing protein n=1 Tax=unclassified Rhizobium TaxID=2613769 RepID=UPI001AD9B723|nr:MULTISPECIES: Rieske 2Fe-2S domain-containing protein [unclassified Rhizobium]MBO9125500.1 Rieske 2Fe-2S domain-containing protein [Rhizobium sp. 16-488-2b]MBO9176085.1 Rieske 2Fe-2S domain-containing protein [Rhizobium sp. 16-488-2a]